MKKIIIIWIVLTAIATANILDEKVRNLMQESNYQSHKKLTKILFRNKEQFYKNEKLNLPKIINTLKENGLLKLNHSIPKKMELGFKVSKNPIKTIKIVEDIFKSMGYYYIFTKKASLTKDGIFVWTINIQTKNMPDPSELIKRLYNQNIKVVDISRYGKNSMSYELETSYSRITAMQVVPSNKIVNLKKPFKEYFLSISPDSYEINIKSNNQDRWYPYIVYFDINLQVLKVIRKKTKIKKLATTIPTATRYIKIGDNFNLKNIKTGLTVMIK